MPTTPTRAPGSPTSAFLWAAYWAVAAAAGLFVLFSQGSGTIGQMPGQRARALLVAGPFVALALVVLLIVVGVRRVAAHARLSEPLRQSLQMRLFSDRARRPGALFILAGIALAVIVAAGSTAIAFAISSGTNRNHDPQTSIGVLVFVASLFSAAWLFLLQSGFSALAARRALTRSGSQVIVSGKNG